MKKEEILKEIEEVFDALDEWDFSLFHTMVNLEEKIDSLKAFKDKTVNVLQALRKAWVEVGNFQTYLEGMRKSLELLEKGGKEE